LTITQAFAAEDTQSRKLRVVFCWPEVSGYIAACWRALMAVPGLEISIIAHQSGVSGSLSAFNQNVVASLPCRLLDVKERLDAKLIAELVIERNPDVIVLPGWGIAAYRQLIVANGLSDRRFVMFMDTPFKNTLRQKLGRLKHGNYIDRMDAVMVAGERSWQFARRLLKVPEQKLHRGMNGIDYDAFASAMPKRMSDATGWPRHFLYMGRFAQVKGLDVLADAYAQYRSNVDNPWPLTCHGNGPLANLLNGAGIINGGFLQPSEQPDAMRRFGVLVLPSTYEPWGQVLVEAAAAGMPVICTEACGASPEVVKSYYNGLVVPTSDVAALAAALQWMHVHYEELPTMGQRGQGIAAAYSAQMWAKRWAAMFYAAARRQS
jgi:glycosyltransferase involved in cell wall biosynthesis